MCRIAPDVPDHLLGDMGRLGQVLINLLGNAVKFTQQGDILLNVHLESLTSEEACLRFDVLDTGIGIASEKLGAIFDAFTQADASTTRLYGGTGLGLTISQRIIRMMGGMIDVESEAGKPVSFHCAIGQAGGRKGLYGRNGHQSERHKRAHSR
jgi:signal transduction histidine kinase